MGGGEYINPAGAAVGFQLSFYTVFNGTKFENNREIYQSTYYRYQKTIFTKMMMKKKKCVVKVLMNFLTKQGLNLFPVNMQVWSMINSLFSLKPHLCMLEKDEGSRL